MKQVQQGDITFEQVEKIPEGAKQLAENVANALLAEGEQTGHHHVAVATMPNLEIFEKAEDNIINLYLKTPETVTVVHPEHGKVELEQGIWKVGRVNEHDWIDDVSRQVID